MTMDRRQAIKRTAMIMGGLVFAPNAVGLLQGCTAKLEVDWEPVFFDSDQAHLLTVLSDVIIPSGETPGASEVGVPGFIEEMVTAVYNPEEREQFVAGLERFGRQAEEIHGERFTDLDPETQYEFAHKQNIAALEGTEEHPPFFLVMKELTMMGYFTSEPGATEVLRYEDVPGRYDACIPFEEVGRTWAT